MVQKNKKARNPVNPENIIKVWDEFDKIKVIGKAIDGSRKINRNNSTGHVGVSYVKRTGLYRAYITFKGKQYSLGAYENKADAIKARKAAEKELYGNFLEWYEKEYIGGKNGIN